MAGISKERGVDDEGFPGKWVKITEGNAAGQAVFIRDGETIQEAFARRILKDWDKRDNDIKSNKIQANEAKRQEKKEIKVEDFIDDYTVSRTDIGIGGAIGKFREYMKAKGFSSDEVEDARRLTSSHSGSKNEQAKADKEIVDALESGNRLGKAFEARIEFEEALYKSWISKHKNSPEAYKSGIWNGEKSIYRKGNRKTGVEPWTTKEEGADMGSGGIGYDHHSTVEQLMREGYHILGGIGMHLGSPGEAEITFVKYKRRK